MRAIRLAVFLALCGGCEDELAGMATDGAADRAPPIDLAPPPDRALPDGAPPPDAAVAAPYAVRVLTLRPEPTALDLLWLIDDSSSMCAEQFIVPDEIAAFADTLLAELPNLDLALAATVTDMDPGRGIGGQFVSAPAPSIPTPGCIDARNGLPWVPPTEACEALAASGRLPAVATYGAADPVLGEAGPDCEDADCKRRALRFALACRTTVGVRGDDFPAGLSALRAATACDGPNAAVLGPCCPPLAGPDCARFLRPGAARAVVIIADGDDCSVERPFGRDDPAQCAWRAESLVDVPDLVDDLRALGPEPLGVFVWSGPAAITPEGTTARWRPFRPEVDGPACDPAVDPEADFAAWAPLCCAPGDACVGPPRDTCALAPRDGAAATPRYRAVARALGTDAPLSVCELGAGSTLARRIADFAHAPRRVCLGPVDGPLRVTARCFEPERLPGAPCDAPWTSMAGLALSVTDPEAAAACDGLAIELPRWMPPGAEVRVEHLAPLPEGPAAPSCALPAACAEETTEAVAGLTITRAWRCAAPGLGCAGGWCVGEPGEPPHCTIECLEPEDCAIGVCRPVHPEGCVASGGGCLCGF